MSIASYVRILTIGALAIAVAVAVAAGTYLMEVQEKFTAFDQDSGTKQHIAMTPEPINPSWIISGSPVCSSLAFGFSYDKRTRSGFWQCEGPAKFEWRYGVDESIYILEGSAEIEYRGEKFTLEPGDSTRFAYGTTATWTVPKFVRKTYLLNSPHRITKRLIRLTRQSS